MTKDTGGLEYEVTLLARHRGYGLPTTGGDCLDRSAYTLLTRLDLGGPMSIGQLSTATGLDVSTLNRQTAAMLRAELVERIPDPAGGMARKFRMTELGRSRLHRDRNEAVRHLDEVTADWTPDEVTDFLAALRRFNTDIERVLGRDWPHPH